MRKPCGTVGVSPWPQPITFGTPMLGSRPRVGSGRAGFGPYWVALSKWSFSPLLQAASAMQAARAIVVAAFMPAPPDARPR